MVVKNLSILIKKIEENIEAKSKKCTFIRYMVDDFGYLLWDYENHKINRSRDIVFNENVMYTDKLQGNKREKENIDYIVFDEIK